MTALAPVEDRASFVVRRPLPGVTVARRAGELPPLRAVFEHYGVSLQLAGASRWASGGAQWTSAPGSLALKAPGGVAVERGRDGKPDFQVVLFDPPLIDGARAAMDGPRRGTDAFVVDRRDPRTRPLLALHRRLLEAAEPPSLDETIAEAVAALVELAGGATEPRRRVWSAAVTRARALLDARLAETVGLDELSAHACLDKFRLCRAFREQVGLPPHAYVTHRRVAVAQTLLARGVAQAEVAARVGFYDQSLLHRHFKRIVGVTPGAFVRAVG